MAVSLPIPVTNRNVEIDVNGKAWKDAIVTPIAAGLYNISGLSEVARFISPLTALLPSISLIKKEKPIDNIEEDVHEIEENIESVDKIALDIKDILMRGLIGEDSSLGMINRSIRDLIFVTENMATNAARERLDKKKKSLMNQEDILENSDDTIFKKRNDFSVDALEGNKEEDNSILGQIIGGGLIKDAIASLGGGLVKSLFKILVTITGLKLLGKFIKNMIMKPIDLIGGAIKSIPNSIAKAGVLLKSMKFLRVLGWVGTLASFLHAFTNVGRYMKMFKVESPTAAFFGKILGGLGKGLKNAFMQAGTWALTGVGLGAPFGPVGMIIGGLLGAAIGGISGYLGGEKVAKSIEGGLKWFESWWKDFSWKDLFPKFFIDFVEGKISFADIGTSFKNLVVNGFTKMMDSIFSVVDGAIIGMKKWVYDTLSSMGSIGKKIANGIFSKEDVDRFAKIDAQEKKMESVEKNTILSKNQNFKLEKTETIVQKSMINHIEKTNVMKDTVRHIEKFIESQKLVIQRNMKGHNNYIQPVSVNNQSNVSIGSTAIIASKPLRNREFYNQPAY